MKAAVKTEQEVEIKNGYYKYFAGGYLFVSDDKVLRISSGAMLFITSDLMAHEVKDIIEGSYQPCTPTEFWGVYQQTMSSFMLEYHEHVSKGKANDFIAQQSDRDGEFPEKHVV
jgi:hypothetical protein